MLDALPICILLGALVAILQVCAAVLQRDDRRAHLPSHVHTRSHSANGNGKDINASWADSAEPRGPVRVRPAVYCSVTCDCEAAEDVTSRPNALHAMTVETEYARPVLPARLCCDIWRQVCSIVNPEIGQMEGLG